LRQHAVELGAAAHRLAQSGADADHRTERRRDGARHLLAGAVRQRDSSDDSSAGAMSR